MRYYIVILCLLLTNACKKAERAVENKLPPKDTLQIVEDEVNYEDVPLSDIYEVYLIEDNVKKKLTVFKNSCPEWKLGYMDMTETDQYPLNIFKGRSINWTYFPYKEGATIEVRIINKAKVPLGSNVKIFPSRFGIVPQVESDLIKFKLSRPGQFSVEVGENGYKNGLMLFANPAETEIPNLGKGDYLVLNKASKQEIATVPTNYNGIYFKEGVHDIGVFKVPSNIKNIYLAPGSWVYGALIMDGNPNVKVFGRGVLSSGRLKYRESHAIEAINQSDNIKVEGITVADGKYFTVRLIGKNNLVNWVKVIGGWTYNLDGISAFAGSTVSNCFIWANDDNIKVYRDDIVFKDIVCWQLNNGGLIQLSWGGGNAKNVTISRVDILHAEWNNQEVNRGILSCVGDKFAVGGMYGLQQNFVIEDLVTETPVPLVFRVSPNPASPNEIHGMVFKNWKIQMDMSKGFNNYIIGPDPQKPFDGIVFDNFLFNGVKFTTDNWTVLGRFQVANISPPTFK